MCLVVNVHSQLLGCLNDSVKRLVAGIREVSPLGHVEQKRPPIVVGSQRRSSDAGAAEQLFEDIQAAAASRITRVVHRGSLRASGAVP